MANILQTLSVYYDDNFVSNQEGGLNGLLRTKQRNNHKIYIELKSSKKRYLVRTDKDKNHKYILIDKKKVSLNSIKGQFRYVK